MLNGGIWERRSGRHWCETREEGLVDGGVEEPWNSISSLWIGAICLAPLLIDRGYIWKCRPSAVMVYVAVGVMSLSSSYFHATLSLFGQLADELSIVWATFSAGVVWLPGHSEEKRAEKPLGTRLLLIVLGIIYTVVLFAFPHLNAFFLMLSLLWIVALIRREMELFPVPEARWLAWSALGFIVAGAVVWVSEELFCPQLRVLGFPYLHSFWHIFAGTALHCVILFSQFSDAAKLGADPKIQWFLRVYPHLIIASSSSTKIPAKTA